MRHREETCPRSQGQQVSSSGIGTLGYLRPESACFTLYQMLFKEMEWLKKKKRKKKS